LQRHGIVLFLVGIIGTALILVFSTGGGAGNEGAGVGPQLSALEGTQTPEALATLELTATPLPTATIVPTPTVVPPTPTPQIRFSCTAIRGTNYLSDEERIWFLNNC